MAGERNDEGEVKKATKSNLLSVPNTMIATLIAWTALGGVGVSSAAADIVINEKALPTGMTVAPATTAAKKAKARTSALIAKRDAETQKKMESALKELDPVRKGMEQVAKSDPEYKAFLDEAVRIMGEKSSKSRFQALNELYRKGKATAERAYKKGGGDPKRDNDVIPKYFKGTKAIPEGILTFGGRYKAGNATIASEIRFTAPYAVHDTDTHKGGLGFTSVNTSIANNDAKMELSAEATSVGLFCDCSASGTAGVFVDVPAGKRKLKVNVLYDYSFRAGMWAALGIGTAGMGGLISVVDVADESRIAFTTLDFESAVAVLAWYVEVTNDETSFVTLSLDVTPGKRYLIEFRVDASALADGGGGGGSFVTLTPTAIEVEFLD